MSSSDRLGYLLAFMSVFLFGEIAGAVASSPRPTDNFGTLFWVTVISIIIVGVCGAFYNAGKASKS